tara:strand:- start:2975 stop:3166 length:192 start_codon:yes stop_codon:yes gene_type:complete
MKTLLNLIYTNTNEARFQIVKTKEDNDFVNEYVNKEMSRIEVYTTKDAERATQRALEILLRKK